MAQADIRTFIAATTSCLASSSGKFGRSRDCLELLLRHPGPASVGLWCRRRKIVAEENSGGGKQWRRKIVAEENSGGGK